MSIGPFSTYVPPGVFTRTLTQSNTASSIAGLRIPVEIGVGQQELEQLDLELVRGSSSTLDTQIVREDVSSRFVVDETNPSNPTLGFTNGLASKFKVRNFPIVDGQGFGNVTNDINTVNVWVNDEPTAVGSVVGADGYVTLQIPPQPGDNVRCTYNFHRSDTSFTDNLSSQITPTQAELITPGYEPFVVTSSSNVFVLEIDGVEKTVTLAVGSYTAAGLKTYFDSQAISGLATAVFADNQGLNHLRFLSARNLRVGTGTANGVFGFSAGTQTNRNQTFRVYQRPMVDGTGGGVTTTDPSRVVVKVNNVVVTATAVDGTNGLVTLPYAPASGSTLTIQYYANTWQDTFDYLPNTMVTGVIRSGFASGRNDFIEGQDFVISNPSKDVSIIHWGASTSVNPSQTSPGATPFDGTQVLPTLVDDKLYLSEATRVIDTTVVPALVSDRKFLLSEIPTTGNGRDSVLNSSAYNNLANGRIGLNTNRPDLVVVYTGRDLPDALGRSPAVVTEVDGANRTITLKNPVPPDHKAYASFYYNRLRDDRYIMTCTVPGPIGSGQFEVLSTLTGTNVSQVRFGTKTGLAEIVQWPRGVENVPDAFHTGAGTPVAETVTVTFSQTPSTNAVYTNMGASPYSFYNSYSDQWRTTINGTSYVTNLAAASKGYLVSKRVPVNGSNQITIAASPNNVLELTIDGVNVTVTLTAGARTPTQIVGEINTAIDAASAFSGTAPNTLASFVQVGGSGGDAIFVIQSYSTPAALPGGFDHKSTVAIRQGTVEATLGFVPFQAASGTPRATTKPATILGSEVGPFNITSGVNDVLNLRVDGVDYSVTLPAGATVAASAVAAAIVAVPGLTGVGTVGTLGNLNKIRLTSQVASASSSIRILAGSANETLGFSEGDLASQVLVSAGEVVNRLNATASFSVDGVAYVSTLDGQEYVTIESLTLGASASSVVFVSGTASAFNTTAGTGIVPGTSGDNGANARDRYTVSSNNPNGSSGTGYPGQTYTDTRTGLRFTVLPSLAASYTSTGSFTLEVSPTWKVNPSIPYLSIAGLEVVVTDTVGIGVNDTGLLQTFNPSGLEPAIGDFYFVSYRYTKQDLATARLFREFKTIEANYGRLSAENRVTLGAHLMIVNGAVLVGIKQVEKVVNTNQASDVNFIQAINALSGSLPGNIRPSILVPLTNSSTVFGALMKHCEIQSDVRNASERMGFVGFASGTKPINAQAVARGLKSSRIIAFYPDSAVITLTNELGQNFESLVDGSYFAAAVAGAVVSPTVDVATPYLRRSIAGFTSIPRQMDPVEANQTAVSGITILEDLDPVIRIRDGLTTNMTDVFSREPTVVQITDYVQQQSRTTLDTYVGSKLLASRTNEIEVTMSSMFRQQKQAEIIADYTGVSASVDVDDPTLIYFESYYQPVFPLKYIMCTFNLRARL